MKNSAFNNEQILQEAAEWALLIDDRPLSNEERQHFAVWIKLSPLHVSEFLLAYSIFATVQESTVTLPEDLSSLILNNVVSLAKKPTLAKAPDKTKPFIANYLRQHYLSSACLVLGLVLGIFLLDPTIFHPKPLIEQVAVLTEVISTDIGEKKMLTLSDGSKVHLNTASEMQYVINDSVRRVYLTYGEAFFDIVEDSSRPFIIHTDDSIIRVIGTAFNVRATAGATRIEVSEGVVTASTKSLFNKKTGDWTSYNTSGAQNVGFIKTLNPGDKAIIDSEINQIKVSFIDSSLVAVWRDNKLVFDNSRLADIVFEYNRYNSKKMYIADKALAEQRLSGVFDSKDLDSFIEYLRFSENIIVSEDKASFFIKLSENLKPQ